MVALFLALAFAAEPTEQQVELLTVFRHEFIAITPGGGRFPRSFTMGRPNGGDAEQPVHEVTFAGNFEVCKYEVPQNLWEAVTGSNPSKWKGSRNSVEMLSYDEAREFCHQATELMQAAKLIEPRQVIRLPTEAEWEYVARAGTQTLFSFGDDAALLNDYGWHTGNAAGNDPPVGAKQPNAWGLYDVHGYLWEWCLDPWHDSYTGAPADGSAWLSAGDANRRVLRGGSWKDKAERLTSSFRLGLPAETRDDAIGLRCVLAESR